MRQLTLAVLIAAVISLALRLVGGSTAGAHNAPPKRERIKTMEPTDKIYPAVCRADAPGPKLTRDDKTGPDRTPRGDDVSASSGAVPWPAAKPAAAGPRDDLALARTPPPAVGPDGVEFRLANAGR